MPAIRSEHGRVKYGVYDFVYDTVDEFRGTIHSGIMPGSTAFIIETSTKYMLNSKNQWVEILIGTSSSGSGSGGSGSGSSGSGSGSGCCCCNGGGGSTNPPSGGGEDEDDEEEVIYNGGDLDLGEDWGLNQSTI